MLGNYFSGTGNSKYALERLMIIPILDDWAQAKFYVEFYSFLAYNI